MAVELGTEGTVASLGMVVEAGSRKVEGVGAAAAAGVLAQAP